MNLVKLNVPYRSQWDVPDANLAVGDCGPTCVAMLLNGLGKTATPNDLYYVIYPELKNAPNKQVPNKGYTNFGQLFKLAQAYGVMLDRFTYAPGGALNNLKASIVAGKPSIALVKYATWRAKTGNNFDGAHFVVAVGCDDDHVLVHDPLFGSGYGTDRAKGAYFEWANDEFKTAWGGFAITENPNYACLTTEAIIPFVAGAEPSPDTGTDGKTGQTTSGEEPQPVNVTPLPLLAELKRRIVALAAYEVTPAPNLDDPVSLNYWSFHVGQWGAQIALHIVNSGDSLWSIAAQYYGQGGKWRAIMAYNELPNSVLSVGQRLEIPLPGRLDVGDTLDPTRQASEEQDAKVPLHNPSSGG